MGRPHPAEGRLRAWHLPRRELGGLSYPGSTHIWKYRSSGDMVYKQSVIHLINMYNSTVGLCVLYKYKSTPKHMLYRDVHNRQLQEVTPLHQSIELGSPQMTECMDSSLRTRRAVTTCNQAYGMFNDIISTPSCMLRLCSNIKISRRNNTISQLHSHSNCKYTVQSM